MTTHTPATSRLRSLAALCTGFLLLPALSPSVGAWSVIGNPGPGLLMADGHSIASLKGRIWLDEVELTSCSGSIQSHTINQQVTLGGPAAFSLPTGCWEAMTLEFGNVLELDGSNSAGGDFQIDVALTELELVFTQALTVHAGAATPSFLLELAAPNWWVAGLVNVPNGQSQSFSSSSAEALDLKAQIGDDSALFWDQDADGEIDPVERSAGLLALTP